MSEAQAQIFFYGVKLLVVIALSIVVVFRRQMSCNRVYVDEEGDESVGERNNKKHSVLVSRDCEGDCGSLTMKKSHHSDTKITNSEQSTGRRIQTSILQAVLRLGRQDVYGLFPATETAREEQCAQHCSCSNTNGSNTDDVSQHATSVIHKREYNAAHLLGLPPDIQINIISYLHPRDVLSMSCSDHRTQNLINGDEVVTRHCSSTAALIWFTLWTRDYGWVLREWNIGMEAIQRSCCSIVCSTNDNKLRCPSILAATLNMDESSFDNLNIKVKDKLSSMNAPIPSMKEFYLIFSLTWQDYCIAGHSTMTSCLTGIHGHVFDMTEFLPNHPGSPDSLIMQGGGKDATGIFESVGHSIVARKIAWNACALAVDLGCCTGSENRTGASNGTQDCGIVPFKTILKEERVSSILPRHRSKPRMPGTLRSTRKKLQRGIESARRKAVQTEAREMTKRGGGDIVGNINVYFDPICQRWKGWHLDMEFCPVFLHDL